MVEPLVISFVVFDAIRLPHSLPNLFLRNVYLSYHDYRNLQEGKYDENNALYRGEFFTILP